MCVHVGFVWFCSFIYISPHVFLKCMHENLAKPHQISIEAPFPPHFFFKEQFHIVVKIVQLRFRQQGSPIGKITTSSIS